MSLLDIRYFFLFRHRARSKFLIRIVGMAWLKLALYCIGKAHSKRCTYFRASWWEFPQNTSKGNGLGREESIIFSFMKVVMKMSRLWKIFFLIYSNKKNMFWIKSLNILPCYYFLCKAVKKRHMGNDSESELHIVSSSFHAKNIKEKYEKKLNFLPK